jgi:Uncharacterized protein conserved in bacteria
MRIQDVIANLLIKQPFYGYFAASVTPVESKDVATISMVSTPYLGIQYNMEWFEALKQEHAVGVVLHELLHLILLHPYRKGSRERNLWTVACDMAVNEHIDIRLLPEDSVTVAKISEEFKENIPRLKSAEFYYDVISKNDEQLSFITKESEVRIVLKSGHELKANNSGETEASEVSRNAVKCMISELVDQARAEGEIPGGILGYINEFYKSNEINWRNVLRRFLSGKGKVQIRKTCKKESKRFENLPGNNRIVGNTVLLALDESGSITDKYFTRFFSELLSIKKLTGSNINVIQFDTQCTAPVPIEKFVRQKQRVGYGGTDFRPVFELADKLRVPLLIIFTDGQGPAPEHVNQKVLWILTKDGSQPAAYGHSLTFS